MKNTFLLILLYMLNVQMFGQLDQGSFLLGGGLSAYSNHDEYSGDFFGNKYEIDVLGHNKR